MVDVSKPLDLSFNHLTNLENVGIDGPRSTRIGGIPQRNASRKYLTRTIWLNNNKLSNIKGVDTLVKKALADPTKLGWLDFSFNFITEIDESILNFTNLRIIYFHGNLIKEVDEIFKLKPLKELRSVTFHGNPVSELVAYRGYVITYLPQVVNLDFSMITDLEKRRPKPPDAVKKVTEAMKNKNS